MKEKLSTILLGLLIFSGCTVEAQRVDSTSNAKFQVALLFEHEGCRAYRFWDAGRPIYYTSCRGSTAWTQRNGKTHRPVEVPSENE